jgi:hypothetical protein
MALPEQIRKQTEAVQELYKQLNDADNNTGNSVADGTAAPNEPVSTPQADEDTVSNIAAQPQGTTSEPSGISQEDDPNSETYAQKWRTLQGMYNAEVPRLHHQNKEMQQRVQQMEQLLASMSATQQAAPAAPVIDRLVSEKEVEEYGESLDVMRKVSREELVPMAQRLARIESVLQQLQVNVVPQVQAVAHRQQMTTEQKFWSDLASAVPNWRDINDNDAFQTWLLDIDPLTGITRQTYLEDAQRSLDALRVSSFFRTWLESTGQAVGQSAGNVNAAVSELEKQVVPGRSRGAGAPSSANKGKTYSPQDIQKFFNDVRAGKYKGREQERDRTERDIFAAQRENRIVANA